MNPTTNVEIPDTDTIIFAMKTLRDGVLEDIWTPEGYGRITFWRNYNSVDTENFGLPVPTYTIGGVENTGLQVADIVNGVPTLGMGYGNHEWWIDQRILTKLPIIEREVENFFGEAVIHECGLGLYNTNNPSDVLGTEVSGGSPIQGGQMTFGLGTYARLLFKYLLPDPTPIKYFPIPEVAVRNGVVLCGTDGSITLGVFFNNSPLPPFDVSMLGYKLCIATISNSVTVPAAIHTIIDMGAEEEFTPPPLNIHISANYTDLTRYDNLVWAVFSPPFDLINQDTSVFGNYGTGTGNNFQDTTSNGGSSFVDDMQGQVILINFVPYSILDVLDEHTVTVGSYNGGPSSPPAGPAYWQVIHERITFLDTPLYVKVEFLQNGQTAWRTRFVGQISPATSGEDYRWIKASELAEKGMELPILDERDNAPVDAEQIRDLKAIHNISSGMGKLPIMPTTIKGDTSSWYMPWALGGSQALPIEPATNILPCLASAKLDGAIGLGPLSGVWAAHIDWRYAVGLMMDGAFGPNNYTVTSDDSPIELEGALLTTITLNHQSNGANDEMHQRPAGNWLRPNFAQFGKYFIPQCLFGLQQQIMAMEDGSTGIPVPRSTCWPDYLLTAWDAILEVSLDNGFLPLLTYDRSTGLPNLHFKDRTKTAGIVFSGYVPVEAKPETMIETEMGIQVVGLQTFLNQRQPTDGWYDDLYAMKKGHGVNSPFGIYDIGEHFDYQGNTGLDDTVNPRMANPYTVPGTPTKPTVFQSLMRYAGYTFAWYNSNPRNRSGILGTQIQGVGIPQLHQFTSQRWEYVDSEVGLSVNGAVFYPTLVPLIPGTNTGGIIFPPLPDGMIPPVGQDFSPVVRARFTFTDAKGNQIMSICTAKRQALARLYATLFVQSGDKYSLTDATLTQFWLINSDGTRDEVTGPDMDNISLFNERMMPDPSRYWCKSISEDWNSMSTQSTYLKIGGKQFIGQDGNFFDSNEGIGPLSPGSPPETDGPPASGGGKVTGQ